MAIRETVELQCPWCGKDGMVGVTTIAGKEEIYLAHDEPRCDQFMSCDDPIHFVLGIAPRKAVN